MIAVITEEARLVRKYMLARLLFPSPVRRFAPRSISLLPHTVVCDPFPLRWRRNVRLRGGQVLLLLFVERVHVLPVVFVVVISHCAWSPAQHPTQAAPPTPPLERNVPLVHVPQRHSQRAARPFGKSGEASGTVEGLAEGRVLGGCPEVRIFDLDFVCPRHWSIESRRHNIGWVGKVRRTVVLVRS